MNKTKLSWIMEEMEKIIVAVEECTDLEIEGIVFKLGNREPISKSQTAVSKIDDSLTAFIHEVLMLDFFRISCNFSQTQRDTKADWRSLIKSMMLLDTNIIQGFEMKDFSERSLLEYYENIKESYGYRQRNTLRSAVQYLENAFPEWNENICEISIPILIYLADVAQYNEVKPELFHAWWSYFTEEDELFDVYRIFCSSDSEKLGKIIGRLAIMTKSFCQYFKQNIPEELKDMVAEVENR